MWLQPCSVPMRTAMKTSVKSLASGSLRTGCSTQYPVTAATRARNQARPANPSFRVRGLASFGERDRFSGLGSDVLRLRTDGPVVRCLLEHVRRPSGNARHGKGGREEVLRQADRLQDPGGVELDVRGLRALRMLLVQDGESGLLDLRREVVELRVQALAHDLEDPRARVIGAVDAVPEAHESFLAVARLAQPVLGILGGADLLQLVHHSRGRASVGRTFQGADGADDARDQVRIG